MCFPFFFPPYCIKRGCQQTTTKKKKSFIVVSALFSEKVRTSFHFSEAASAKSINAYTRKKEKEVREKKKRKAHAAFFNLKKKEGAQRSIHDFTPLKDTFRGSSAPGKKKEHLFLKTFFEASYIHLVLREKKETADKRVLEDLHVI